jgi:hypothetical protein
MRPTYQRDPDQASQQKDRDHILFAGMSIYNHGGLTGKPLRTCPYIMIPEEHIYFYLVMHIHTLNRAPRYLYSSEPDKQLKE